MLKIRELGGRISLFSIFIAGSSNGRTPDSGSGNWGSNPCPAASLR